MSNKIVAAFRDPDQKCMFVRYSNGAIDCFKIDGDHTDSHRWLGDFDDSPDPEGIVWAALTKGCPVAESPASVAKLDRIRAAARKLSIDQGGVRDNPDVAALLVEIFAP